MVIGGVTAVASIIGLVLYASGQKMNLFYTPTEIAKGQAPSDKVIRIGGLVKQGSVKNIVRDDFQLETHFVVTDRQRDIPVSYSKVLPDLFKEGQGVVALGRLNAKGVFVASEVLAKHDEEYKAPEVLDALRRAGHPVKTEG